MELIDFLAPAVYLIAVATVCVLVFKRVGLGAVLGLLVAGVVVGPHTPGPVATEDVAALREFTQVGVVLLLFMIGLEMDPHRLWRMRREVFGLGTLQVAVTGALLALYVRQVFPVSWPIALLLGFTFALSSTALVLQILEERGEIASSHGRPAFAVLLFQDLAVVPLIAVVPVLAGDVRGADAQGWLEHLALVAGTLGAVVTVGRYVLPRLLELAARQRNMEVFALIAMLAVLGAAWATGAVGLPMELGAFVMGMMLSRSEFHYQLLAMTQPFKGLMLGLFFISVGMSIDVQLLMRDFAVVAEAVVVIMAMKAAVLVVIVLAFRMDAPDALRIGLALPQCGEFGFVVFALAGKLGVLDERAFLTGVVVIAVSMLLTPFSAKLGDLAAARLARRRDGAADLAGAGAAGDQGELAGHVVVAGYGRMGQTVCALLQASDVPYLAFDDDRARVALARKVGHRTYFGDLENTAFLASVGLGRAKLAVIAIHNAPATRRGVSHVRQLFPHVPLVVRVRDLAAAHEVATMGAALAFPEALEAGLEFGCEVLRNAGVPSDEAHDLIEGVRRNDYELIRALSGGTPAPSGPLAGADPAGGA